MPVKCFCVSSHKKTTTTKTKNTENTYKADATIISHFTDKETEKEKD